MSERNDIIRKIEGSARYIDTLADRYVAAPPGREPPELTLVVSHDGHIHLDHVDTALLGDPDVFHNICQRIDIPSSTPPATVAEWIKGRKEDLATVCEGMGREYDGRNVVGTLSEEAEEMLTALAGAAELLNDDDDRAIVIFDPVMMFDDVQNELAEQETLEDAIALAAQWAEEGETEHGLDAHVIVDYDIIHEYASKVWKEANSD